MNRDSQEFEKSGIKFFTFPRKRIDYEDQEIPELKIVKEIVKNNFLSILMLNLTFERLLWNLKVINMSSGSIYTEFGILLALVIYSIFVSLPVSDKKKIYDDSVLKYGKMKPKILAAINVLLILSQILAISGIITRANIRLYFFYSSIFIFQLLLIAQIYYFSKGKYFVQTAVVSGTLSFEIASLVFLHGLPALKLSNVLLSACILWAVASTVIRKFV